MKKIRYSILILFIPFVLAGQNVLPAEMESIFFKAYTTNNPTLWEQGIAQLKAYAEENRGEFVDSEVAKAQYGLAIALMANKKEKECSNLLKTVEDELLNKIKKYKNNADIKAILAGIISFQIALSPMKGMWLGPKSSKYVKAALKIDENNVLARFQEASSLYHTPGMFGGDKLEAAEVFEKTVSLYESNVTNYKGDWMYLSSVTWLGIAKKANGELDDAKDVFQKCLEISPEYGWVKYQLLPSVSE